jgi:dCMP deaminase
MNKLDLTYLMMLPIIASSSHSRRRQVGAILTLNGRIVSTGYNGMPKGMENDCEWEQFDRSLGYDSQDEHDEMMESMTSEERKKAWKPILTTKREVIHAEANAILFSAREGRRTDGCTLYVSLSPCVECAKMIIQAGIVRVVYQEAYRDTSGLSLLLNANIEIEHAEKED